MADRVTVLRNGKVAGAAPIAAITQPELIRMISGANVERYRHWASGIGQAALGKRHWASRYWCWGICRGPVLTRLCGAPHETVKAAPHRRIREPGRSHHRCRNNAGRGGGGCRNVSQGSQSGGQAFGHYHGIVLLYPQV